MKESAELILVLKEMKLTRLRNPYDCGYDDGIQDAIRMVRSVRIKRGLRKARKGKTKSRR